MADKREKFSPLTILLHWAVGLAIITLLGVGIYMVDLPRSEWRSTLYGWHKVLGTTVLMVAALRIVWRWRNGMPLPAGDYPHWQHVFANATHIVLLAATIAMPVSGAT
jgi:cytochrome b561